MVPICVTTPVVVSCARKIYDVNSSEMAAERIKMSGISDFAETVAMQRA